MFSLFQSDLTPHGFCIKWSSDLLTLYVVSDAFIFLAYTYIGVSLILFARKHTELTWNMLLWLFAAFILACGVTHLMDIVTFWMPFYWFDVILKIITACVSVGTVLYLAPRLSMLLNIHSHEEFEAMTEGKCRSENELITEKQERREIEILKQTYFEHHYAIDKAAIFAETDAEGVITFVNEHHCRVSGYSKEELIGSKYSLLKSAVHPPEFYDNLWATIKSGHVWKDEVCNRHKNGSLYWLSTVIVPIIDTGAIYPKKYISIRFDITDRKKAEQRQLELAHVEQEKQALQNQLLQAQKVESIGQLTSGVAHDFNNLLMAVTGFSNLGLMLIREGDIEQGISCFEKVDEAANRATDLVQKMLTFCRENTIKAEHPIDPSVVVNEVVGISKMLRSGISKAISIEFHNGLTEDCGGVIIDSSELHQLVTNLIINAKDAVELNNHPNGYISVNLYADHIEHTMYCQSCLKAYTGDYIALSVRDTGVDISEEKISRIFDPFFTTKGVGKGTGLGLSVVSGIVHNAKGHICVESIVGQGTTFSLLFPAVPIEVQNEYEQIKTEISSDESPRAIRVAVIDDEEIICSLFHFSLTRLGYDVTVFNDPVEAWDTFSNRPDLFDVIITDYGMPIVTGLELAKSILGLRPEMPIFICTGYSEKIKFAEDLPKGNTFLFKKPTDVKALDKAIRQFFTTKG